MSEPIHHVNADLYAHDLFDRWANEQGIIAAESILIRSCFTDTNKTILEAGTGGGRIAFYLEQHGFKNIHAFDIVPKMIEHAREIAGQKNSAIHFDVANAAHLPMYANGQFDYLIYPQQVLCFIEDYTLFVSALNEAYRIAKPGCTCVFSFLDFDARRYNPVLSRLLGFLRWIRREKIGYNYLPWLKLNGAYNRKFFHKNQPVLYWVKREEITALLKQVGFSIVRVQNAGELEDPTHGKRTGMLYLICTKP